MSITYSQTAINYRLDGVVTAIGTSGLLKLLEGATEIIVFTLATPCGTVSGGVLSFTTVSAITASVTGTIDSAVITDSSDATVISGLTVGIPLSGANIIIANGLNSLVISAGSNVQLLSAKITGS